MRARLCLAIVVVTDVTISDLGLLLLLWLISVGVVVEGPHAIPVMSILEVPIILSTFFATLMGWHLDISHHGPLQ